MKQKSQTGKVYVCGEGNIKYFMLTRRAKICGKARVKVLIMSELSDSEA